MIHESCKREVVEMLREKAAKMKSSGENICACLTSEAADAVASMPVEEEGTLNAEGRLLEELMRIRELCIKALCRATGDSRDAIEDAPLTRAIAHATQVESERQRLEEAEELLRKCVAHIRGEPLDLAMTLYRADAFLNHAPESQRGG